MKLIIISDLHFREDNDWQQINQISECMIKRINSKIIQNEQILFIVLGDVIDCSGKVGQDNQLKYKEACIFFDKLKTKFDNVLFNFIPGNHELMNNEIISEFHELATQYSVNYKKFTLDESVFSEEVEGFNLIFVDSTLARDANKNGQIDVELLKKHMKTNCKNLIFMHHPPCAQEGADRSLVNSAELISTHANFVFYGHQHGYVKVPDILEKDTDIHAVGALLKKADGIKNTFLLLDITERKIKYARRYEYILNYFNSELLFPKKENIQSQYLKLGEPKVVKKIHSREYRRIISQNSNPRQRSYDLSLVYKSEIDLMNNERFIQLLGNAGIGKTYSLSYMYSLMLENQDYYPLWLNLRNSNYESIKEYLNYAQNCTIDNKTPILFLDGFDEMKSEYVEDFTRDIGSAISGDAEVKIVVSMRTNYNIELDDFEKFELMPLAQKKVVEIAEKNNIKDISNFVYEINTRNCHSLSQNPFYLFEMMRIYKSEDTLPNRANLFDKILNIRFREADERHRCAYAKRILPNEHSIRKELIKISVFLSLVKKDSLDNTLYTEILNINTSEQIQKTGLITKTDIPGETSWQFEHKIFCECLTANFLSKKDLSYILDIITYDTDHKKLRASWINILGILLTLKNDEKFKAWIVENALDEIFEIQPEGLIGDVRDTIFISMFQYCSKLKVPLYAKYYVNNWVKYFNSEKVVDYLMQQLENSSNEHEVNSALYFFQYCTEIFDKENVLISIIRNNYLGSDFEAVRIRSIKVVEALAYRVDFKEISEILSLVKCDSRIDVQAATCALIAKTNTADENSEYLLEMLVSMDKLRNNFSAQRNLVEAVGVFQNAENIIKAIEIISKFNGNIRLFNIDELFSTLVEGLCTTTKPINDPTIQELTEIFINCAREHKRSKYTVLKDCFIKLSLIESIFENILSQKLDDKTLLDAIEAIMEESLAKILIDSYNNDKINSHVIREYVRRLPDELDVYTLLNEAIIKKGGEPIYRENKIDWESINSKGTQNYFDSLFDKKDLYGLIKEIVDFSNILYIECKDLMEKVFDVVPFERRDLHCVITALFNSGEDDTKIINFTEKVKWEKFSLSQIIAILKENENIEVNEKQLNIIEQYFTKIVYCTNFEEKLIDSETINIVRQAVFLMNRFGFNITDDKLLDFLALPWSVFDDSIDSSESLFLEFVELRITDKNKLRDRIIHNLTNGSLNKQAYHSHIIYCLNNKLPDAVSIASNILVSTDEDCSYLNSLVIKYLITMKGEKYVDCLVNENMDEYLLKFLSIELRESNEKLKQVLILKNKEPDDNLLYLKELIDLNSSYAIKKYIKLAKAKKGIPDKTINSSILPEATQAISGISDITLLDNVGELLVLSLTKGFEDTDSNDLFSSSAGAIRKLSRNSASTVKSKLQEIITNNSENEVLESRCNYLLCEVEKILKISQDIPMTTDEALKFIENI